jgi:hypothetical protein
MIGRDMLSRNQKGAIAETAVLHHATRLGIDVYLPATEHGRYDMVFDLGERLDRVQCKWAALYGDVLIIRCASNRRVRDGFLRRLYTADEIDAFAAYSLDLDRCYYLPVDHFPHANAIQLRLAPSRNNQRLRINWADSFDFAATLGRLGAVAQLGERRRGTAEATGSSPVGSIASTARLIAQTQIPVDGHTIGL